MPVQRPLRGDRGDAPLLPEVPAEEVLRRGDEEGVDLVGRGEAAEEAKDRGEQGEEEVGRGRRGRQCQSDRHNALIASGGGGGGGLCCNGRG